MASSRPFLLSATRQNKKSDHLLSIQDSKICYERKKTASIDEDEGTIADFESASLKDMNVTEMSESEQTLLIKNYNSCYQRLNDSTAPRKTYRLTMVLTILQLVLAHLLVRIQKLHCVESSQ
jgi:hypothetical protein